MVQKMAETLERELTELYRSITLEQMLSLTDNRSLPAAADELFGTAQNLTDVVTRKEALPAVGEAWLYLQERWELFEFYLVTIRTPEIRRRIEGVSQSIDFLQDAIGVVVTFDRRVLSRQAATLERTGRSSSVNCPTMAESIRAAGRGSGQSNSTPLRTLS
jgi:hypothetical protein